MPWADAGPVVYAAHKEFVYMCVYVCVCLSNCLSIQYRKSHLPASPSGHAALRLVLAWEPVIRNSCVCARVYECVTCISSVVTLVVRPSNQEDFFSVDLDFYVLSPIHLQSGWIPVWHLFSCPPVLRQGRHASWLPNSPQSGRRAIAAVAATTRVNYALS